MSTLATVPAFFEAFMEFCDELAPWERGALAMLVAAHWRFGHGIPDDDAQLATFAGVDVRVWKAMRPSLAPFFTIAKGRWSHELIMREVSSRRGRTEKASAAMAAKRKGKRHA